MNALKRLLIMTCIAFMMLAGVCYADDPGTPAGSGRSGFETAVNPNDKKGVVDATGAWVIEPIYDEITFDTEVFWLIVRSGDDEIPKLGMWDPNKDARIQAMYVDIRRGTDNIVACCLQGGFDIYDSDGKYLMYISDEWEEVFPSADGKLELMDIDLNFFLLDLHSLTITEVQ